MTNDEEKQVIREAHGSIMAQHYGKNKTIERAKTISELRNMEEVIIYFIKKCPICQQQKTTRIKNQSEAVIPDTPLTPMIKYQWIFSDHCQTLGQGITTYNRLSIQHQLTKYLILIPLKDTEA